MPKGLRHPTPHKPVLRRDHLTREAANLRKRAKLAHDSETRVEFEEMAERRELLALAVDVLEPPDAETANSRGGDEPPEPPPKKPSAAKG